MKLHVLGIDFDENRLVLGFQLADEFISVHRASPARRYPIALGQESSRTDTNPPGRNEQLVAAPGTTSERI
jgi:hypothetical protein